MSEQVDAQDARYQRITLRIPRELHAKLMHEADLRSRSMNAEIIDRLSLSMEYGYVTDTLRKMKSPSGRSELQMQSEAARKKINEINVTREMLIDLINLHPLFKDKPLLDEETGDDEFTAS